MRSTLFFFGLFALATISCATLVAQEKAPTATEYTLAMIKPNAVKANHIGAVIERFEKGQLRVAALKMQTLTKAQAEQFYAVHKSRSFFSQLVEFMTSGPIVAIALEGPHAVQRSRDLMGETDPSQASPGTIRADFGDSITANAVHGSDSVENAKKELAFFFKADEIQKRFQ